MVNIPEILKNQRSFFTSGKTRGISDRKSILKKLKAMIERREDEICKALQKDFQKCEFEALITEIAVVKMELSLMIKKLDSWAKPQKIRASLLNFPSSDKIYKEPYGCVLIIAPWNYPFQLSIAPLVGAIAAGNTVVLKPSELTPTTSTLLASLIKEVFDAGQATVVQGSEEIAQELLDQNWDYIFFTGSSKVGKIVARAAAEHLTSVTLELGGKNPCIVDESIDIKLAAKRIVWGKFINAGQTCIAPDYLLVEEKIKNTLVEALKTEIILAYGDDPEKSPDFARIINDSNFDRLCEMLPQENIAFGGQTDKTTRYIAPTLIDGPNFRASECMRGEIFGPILPILNYKDHGHMDEIINQYTKPLALYIFSKRKKFIDGILDRHSFGGGAVNDSIVQFVNHRLPFGGVGQSGIGAYHGKDSFKLFSHHKAIVNRGTWFDPSFRYAPYSGKTRLIRKFVSWL